MTRTNIIGKQFDEERALYHLQNADVTDCIFAGPADGESVLKESKDVEADVKGHIASVKNPRTGRIIADSVGEIIRGDAVMECTGKVVLRTEAEKRAESISEASKGIACEVPHVALGLRSIKMLSVYKTEEKRAFAAGTVGNTA